MTLDRDPTRMVRAWLETGVTDLPDRLLDSVLDQLPSTPQRRSRWTVRRLLTMNSTLKIATAIAAVVVVGVIGLNLLPGSTGLGAGAAPQPTATPSPTPAPTQAPSASPVPYLPTSGAIAPGRYRIPETKNQGAGLTIQVPAGWTSLGNNLLHKEDGRGAWRGVLFAAWPIGGTFVDPCTDHAIVTPTPGPGVDALADALASQPGTKAIAPTAATVDGHTGKVVEVTVTADIASCGRDAFWIWASPDGEGVWVDGNDEMDRIYILDIDGERLTFNGRFPAATTAADRAELEAIIESIEIDPPVAY